LETSRTWPVCLVIVAIAAELASGYALLTHQNSLSESAAPLIARQRMIKIICLTRVTMQK